ncbi:MAG TPA: sialidase family protein [Terriglobales bacterium]|nr:sialidase family protein [Terriglobales bacterium]
MQIRTLFSAMTLAAVCFTSTTLLYSQSETKAAAPVSDEYLLLGDVNRGAGEPIIFVNPKDPNNIIVAAMATLNRLPTGEVPIQRFNPGGPPKINPAATELRIKELSVPDGSRTDIAVTQDGGKTWSFSEDNFRKFFKKNRCSDSFSGAGPDGTLYMGCLAYLNLGAADYESGHSPNGEANVYHGGSAIAWSTDKGKTWSDPVWVHPANSPQLYPPSVHPVFQGASPWDRPFFVADATTGTIYISGSGAVLTDASAKGPASTDPNGRPSNVRFRTFLRASHDKGRTWDIPMYPIDSDEYPGSGFGQIFSAAHGKLVVAYTATKVPAIANATCPCTIFGTSTDDGKTFHYSVVPPLPAELTRNDSPFMAFAGVMISADPSKEGRYAIARTAGKKIMITLTEDGGKTWLAPVVAAEVAQGIHFGHRSMKYSPKGDLGLIWKAMREDRSFDLWSAASRDGDHTFKTVRVSHAVSPDYITERGNFLFGDDLSTVEVDTQYLHAVWGDNRSGFQGTWYGRVPLSAY